MIVRTEVIDGELRFAGWTVIGPDRLRAADGALLWLLHPPSRRRWATTGALLSDSVVAWRLEPDDGGALVRAEGPVELDVVELDAAAARAFEDDRSSPLTVVGSYAPLGPPADLARFLVGGTVLDTTDFGGRRCPSEQTALSIHAIARRRGGPFWDAAAEHVAHVVTARVRAAHPEPPVHDLRGRGETHMRFLADAVTLLAAAARRHDAEVAADLLEGFGVDWGGGRWYLHDSTERASGANHLVLNTHVHTLLALAGLGRSTDAAATALDHALSLPGEPKRRWALSGLLSVATAMRAVGRGAGLAHRAEEMAARSRARQPHLALPGGWLARDVGLAPAPSYLTVNLHDLAALERRRPTRASSAALRAGLRWAGATGYFRAQRRARDPLAVLQPIALCNAGSVRAAARTADALVDAGYAPALGWPGFEGDRCE